MPLVSNGRLRHRYDEQIRADRPRLGRHLELDARSLAFLPEPDLLRQPIKPAEWPSPIPILDQGQLGSCTGNAGTYHIAQLYKDDLTDVRLDGQIGGIGLNLTDASHNEQFAVDLYHDATVLDGFPGVYPPEDTGSSGLGVCKVLKAQKLVRRYVWATNARAFAALLQRSGCLIGLPWFESWFSPDADGFVDADPNWYDSGIAGGHELYVEALETWDEANPAQSIIRGPNSWGESWGDHGHWRMRLGTYTRLKSQVDLKQGIR